MRRLFAALCLCVLVATAACSGSGNLVGPAPDMGSRAALADGQDPVSNNGVTLTLQGQDPVSNNGTGALLGQERTGSAKAGQEPSSNN